MGVSPQGDSLWQSVLGEIELSTSRASYLTWFKNTVLVKNQDGVVVINEPHDLIFSVFNAEIAIITAEELEKTIQNLLKEAGVLK